MSGGIDLGGALKLIGGNPLLKAPMVIGQFLPLARSLDGGAGLGAIMGQVLNGGLGAILSNPMGFVAGQLQGVIGNALGQLSGLAGAGGLLSSLNGLAGAVDGMMAAGDALLSPAGIQNLIGHAGIADMIGDALPTGLGLDAVLGPLNAGDLVGEIADAVPGVVGDVLAGALSIADATAWVEGRHAALAGVVSASQTAVTAIDDVVTTVSAVSTMAGAFAGAPPVLSDVFARALAPDALAVMQASVAAHLDEPDPEV